MRDRAPDWHADVRTRLRAAKLHPQDEAQLVDELAQHLEAQYADLAPRLGAEAARAQLLAELGEPALDAAATAKRRRARPAPTRVWSVGGGSLWRDVRYALRSLRRSLGMVAAGTAALALGIGLTTVMYSVIYGTLVKGLPYEHAERIAIVYNADPAAGDGTVMTLGDFVRLRAAQRSFDAFGATATSAGTVTGDEHPERVEAARVTAGALDATGVRPLLGRRLVAGDEDPAAAPAALLGYAMWRDRYGADSGVVGRVVRVDGRPFTVVGVMPERFEFPRATRLWLPLQADASPLRPGEGPIVSAVGRLRAGVSYGRATGELRALARRLVVDRVKDAGALRAEAQPYVRGQMPSRVYAVFYVMLGAVMLVLLVACANVANLLLDRAMSRTREIGIRTSLGASRLAVVRQSLVESTLLALLAAVLGTALAQAGILAFNRAMVDVERPFWMDVQLHPPVLAFVLAMTVLASLVSGLLPALQSARLDVSATLKDESHAASSRRVGRMSRAIVGVEIGLSTALLVAAGFMTKSIAKLRTLEPVFTTAGVYTAAVSPPSTDAAERRRFLESLEQRLAALPGVAGAYVGSALPGTGWEGTRIAIDGRAYGRDEDRPSARTLAVSAGFFPTFGVRVLRGRAIAPSDRAGTTPVAVISESFARRHFSDADPIGRRLRLGGADSPWLTIVGIAPTLFAVGFRDPWPAEVLTAYWQDAARPARARLGDGNFSTARVAVRGPADVASAAVLRRAVAAVDADVPIEHAAPMDAALAEPMWALHVFGTMFVIFGIVSLALAAIGLYAVMAFSVSRRTRELGIRLSLGASRRDVIRMICRQGASQIALGVSIGFVAGGALVRLARAVLFEVQPGDPTVFVVVALVLGGAALVACLVPAVRATRVDPLVALRTE